MYFQANFVCRLEHSAEVEVSLSVSDIQVTMKLKDLWISSRCQTVSLIFYKVNCECYSMVRNLLQEGLIDIYGIC